MLSFTANLRRLLADQGGAFVEYSSLLLLVAIAAVAMLASSGGFVPD